MLSSYSVAFTVTVQSGLKFKLLILNNLLEKLNGVYERAITCPAFNNSPFGPILKFISLVNRLFTSASFVSVSYTHLTLPTTPYV